MSNKEKLLAAAQKFLQKNNLTRAIKEYLKVIELDPKDVRSRQKLAELYSRTSQVEQAITQYAAVASYYSENTFYLKAIAVYKQMQKLVPDNVDYTLKLAHLNEQQGLIGNALSEYRLLLNGYEKSGENDKAVEILNKMRALDPANITIGIKIAEFCARNGDADAAQKEFAAVEQKLQTLANYQQLHKFYEHFASVWPDNIAVQIGMGMAMVEYGEPLGGVELLKKLQRQYPRDFQVLFALSRGFHACGDYPHEIECLQRLTKNVPDSLEYQVALYDAALAANDTALAFTSLQQGKQLFYAAGKVSDLKPYYEQLRELLPDDRDVLSALHDIYEELGEGEKLFDVMSAGFGDEENAASETLVEDASAGGQDAFAELEFKDEDSSTPSSTQDDISFDDITFDIGDDESTSGAEDDFDFDLTDNVAAPVDIHADLEEADFYLQQGLLEEAQQVCKRLEAVSPDNKKVLELKDQLLLQLQKQGGKQVAAPSTPIDIGVSFGADNEEVVLDLDVSDLDASLDKVSAADNFDFDDNDIDIESSLSGLDKKKAPEPEQNKLADSQRGVVTVINDEDTESAYNLGIAYKEMGLIDDAIVEFDKAMASSARKIDSILLKAACYIEQQKFETAEDVLTLGLSDSALSKKEQVLMFYETGLLYEAWARYADALSSYQVVADNDPTFRDVAIKVSELKDMVDNEFGAMANADRISYL
ncbi:MAG: tetratricopeptide repeat protein [Desulfuromonas sp.]|nr:tetratricopeptide repeat protein [Desulfuromonas sp.]